MYPGREMVYFDTVNETVKIKRFSSTAVSGFASGLRYGTDSNILVPAIQFYRNFRSPKVGDFLYLYNGTALELSGASFKV
jgi:hypothetical protein